MRLRLLTICDQVLEFPHPRRKARAPDDKSPMIRTDSHESRLQDPFHPNDHTFYAFHHLLTPKMER